MKKRIIGYTSGVFDLFHIGHLNVLKKAKEQCDYLVVGVTTDELVQKRKNQKPIISYNERKQIIESVKYVDQVVSQSDMNKFKMWKKIEFNKMFVGDDWKGTDKWNQYEKEFNEVGVTIVYFPYTETTSSTLLRAVIKKFIKA
jgi:glycerol-3-phosphate cytidylyltransferase